MNIIGLQVPEELESDLSIGGRSLSPAEHSRLKELLQYVESPLPAFFSYDDIIRANQLWNSPQATHYLGVASESIVPGNIDGQQTLIIGQAEPDSPIALDYRTAVPRIVYFGDIDNESYWIELSEAYGSLFSQLAKVT